MRTFIVAAYPQELEGCTPSRSSSDWIPRIKRPSWFAESKECCFLKRWWHSDLIHAVRVAKQYFFIFLLSVQNVESTPPPPIFSTFTEMLRASWQASFLSFLKTIEPQNGKLYMKVQCGGSAELPSLPLSRFYERATWPQFSASWGNLLSPVVKSFLHVPVIWCFTGFSAETPPFSATISFFLGYFLGPLINK